MIISASYKTDIPAFYGDWFINRLRAGFCKMFNPYNQRPVDVSLRPADVDGFVFWTRNVQPFLKHLPEVRDRAYPFVMHYGITGYPRELEHAVIDVDRALHHFRQLAGTYGPRVCVWRYDTIIDSSLTPPDWHRHNFTHLASQLAGASDEVVISFAQFYQKTQRNMTQAAAEHGFTWRDPPLQEKRQLAADLVSIAKHHGLQLSICSQRDYLVPGAADARCIDAVRLGDIAGKPLPAKLRGNRKDCGCYASRDIGHYDTCPHGCVYCYAVRSRQCALNNRQRHDPMGEFLLSPQQ